MIMNVPSAPEMQGTPMAPDLSMEMQPDMADVSQAEMQEAQGALMQILQVINMLIEQGLNEEQIRAFLKQYGISEDELDQAAQALGVDIDAVLSGQMQAPQEPMMMAEGGPATNVSDRTQSEQLGYSSFRLAVLNPERADSDMIKKDYLESVGPEIYAMDEANILAGNEPNEFLKRGIQNFGQFSQNPITVAPSVISSLSDNISTTQQPRPQQMKSMSDNEPMMQARSRENQIFTLQSQINNLMNDYNIAVRDQDFNTAQAIANQINNIDVQITRLQSQMPMMMAEGGGASTSIDPSYISEYLQMLEEKQAELFNLTRKAPGINPTGLSPDMSLAKRRQQFESAKRDLRQATRALNPEVFQIYEAGQFRKLPTMFSKQVIEDYINFVNQKKQTEKKN